MVNKILLIWEIGCIVKNEIKFFYSFFYVYVKFFYMYLSWLRVFKFGRVFDSWLLEIWLNMCKKV